MEILEALDLTFQHAQQVIDNVRPDQLDNKTPCPEWTVRDLLEHQIGVGSRASVLQPREILGRSSRSPRTPQRSSPR